MVVRDSAGVANGRWHVVGPTMDRMNVTSVLSRQIARSPGAVRARRSGLVTMAVFTGAWSMLGLASGVLALQVTACVLIVAAVFFLIGSTRSGASARAGKTGPESAPIARLPAPSDSRFVVAVIAETVAIAAAVFVL